VSSDPPPKYIEIIDAMRTRIDRDLYRVGEKLPSEAQLVREFGASRSTVVRALEFLRQEGWIQGVQGRGRIVLQRTAPVLSRAPERVDRLLRPETYAVSPRPWRCRPARRPSCGVAW
jgi:GntR family transcriptional regulator